MWFRIVSEIVNIESIASGRSIRERARLQKNYGGNKWRKLKGTATVELPDGASVRVELYGYEAHGIGRREMKIKRILG